MKFNNNILGNEHAVYLKIFHTPIVCGLSVQERYEEITVEGTKKTTVEKELSF